MMRSHRNHLHHNHNHNNNHDHHSRLLHDLSTLVINLLRSPPSPIPFPDDPSSTDLVTRRSSSITPAGFASLMLGMSLALMLCGSVTFFIGFMLMPWVLGLIVLLYVAGIVSALSFLACSIICFATGPPSPKKEIPCKLPRRRSLGSLWSPFPQSIILRFLKGSWLHQNECA